MDNALIEDRIMHVDFSQSVAKLLSQHRQKANQVAKEKGCFKCGVIDHTAKDCAGGPASNLQPPKYILKDDDIQLGGVKTPVMRRCWTKSLREVPEERTDMNLMILTTTSRNEDARENFRGPEYGDHEKKGSNDRYRCEAS